MSWLTSKLRQIAALSQEAPAAMPAANDPDVETELEQLRQQVYEQRIRINGLSKTLRDLRSRVSDLGRHSPAIHSKFFPQPSHIKRK